MDYRLGMEGGTTIALDREREKARDQQAVHQELDWRTKEEYTV